ncbi:hypothetical protein J4730_06650 [Klebsiella pneumoniae]|uniref:Uncharacterized protein n=1 Tax=Klebsiella pneumoniae TaxID=573 RepID=A0A939SUL8_KLEPN|nr:hypothetical protein [Klebsiella pneumoniae]
MAARARWMLAQPRYAGGTFEGADAATVEDAGSRRGAEIRLSAERHPAHAGGPAIYRLDDPRYFGLHDIAGQPVARGGRARCGALLNGRPIVEDDYSRSRP